MAGFGKNPRHGKRPPSSSSSSYLSTISMVVLVTFCLIGVWMLTSSSIVPSQATSNIARAAKPISRFLKDPPPGDLEGQPAEEEEEEKVTEVKEETIVQKSDENEDGRKNDEETRQEENQQQLDGGEGQQEETQQQQQKTETEENQTQSGESQQEAHDEQQPNEETQQETQQTQTENQQETKQDKLGEIDWENQQETKQNQEQQVRTDDFDNHQETNQQQGTESNADVRMQPGEGESNAQTEPKAEEKVEEEINDSKPEMEENRDIEPHIEEVTTETNESNDAVTTESNESNEAVTTESTESNEAVTTESNESNEAEQQTGTEGSSEENQQDAGGNGGQEQGDDKLFDNPNSNDLLPDAGKSEVPNNGGGGGKKKAWATQADQSENEKERRMEESGYEWELCNVTAGPDYIPCLDNEKAIKQLHIKHYEHRERHCPEESPSCLVPLPNGYKHSIEWPKSRDKIWYNNVPHTKLAEVKGHQNWVKVAGEYLTFPGGGTQFIHGALHYIDFIQQSVHDIAWGKHTRTVLDVGCGVASFGGYLFERDVLTMSFAPKDEHEAQVQLALERGIPAMSAVMGSQRLPFPSRVFDLVHCARCRVPWHADGGMLLLELNRVLRPGGYFVWSATPVYQRLKEDIEIWKAMKALTVSMCWDLISTNKDKLNSVGAAFFRKPVSNDCYDSRKHHSPPMCKEDDDPNAAWYIPLKACMHRVPIDASDRGSKWPAQWPQRLQVPPYWLNNSQIGIYGKSTPDDFRSDYEHWKRVVTKSYLTGFGIDWSRVRNVMDMRAVYGGFSAALRDLKVWSLNVVNIDSPDTLPIIYERGLFGIYHDWCESFSTYPRTYDLLHADHLFSVLKKRCKIVPVLAEVDRIVRPGGKLIVRDESRTVTEVENLLKSLHWEVHLTFSKDQEGILCAEKSDWRPEKFSDSF